MKTTVMRLIRWRQMWIEVGKMEVEEDGDGWRRRQMEMVDRDGGNLGGCWE